MTSGGRVQKRNEWGDQEEANESQKPTGLY